jgi:hypothetical protein
MVMIMKWYRKIFINAGLIIVCGSSFQTGYSQQLTDSLIPSAMRDELQRNLTSVAEGKIEKPFFISYTIANARSTVISATLGAISSSNRQSYKDWQVRLMVGDYDINDENFNYNQPEEMIFKRSIPMPVDNDYSGIRRSLWLTTNNVYESAAETYKNKIALIEHKQLGDSALEIPDFSHAPVVHFKRPDLSSGLDQVQLEEKARELSAIFKEYQEIYSSSITINVFESMVYFINSEGTEVQFPCNITTLTILAGTMSDDSERLNRSITYTVDLPEKLPENEAIKNDIRKLLENIQDLKIADRFEDEYTGPILIIGEAAAESMESFLFAGSDALIAYRETLESSDQMNMYYEHNDNSLQSKINKQIISKDITITAQPFLEEYRGTALLGAFRVDAEGVIPPDNLILVERGVLKTLLNGRTPSRYVPESNGHMRFSYNFRGLTSQVGPGVIKISSKTTYSIEDLKKELIKQAQEQGLEYAIIIRSLDVGGSDKPYNYFKVNVSDGEEKIIRSARLKNMSLQALKRSPLFSDSILIHNTLLATNNDEGRGLSGIPSSFILPKAILVQEAELESYRKPLTSMLPIINNPVGLKKQEQKTISNTEE